MSTVKPIGIKRGRYWVHARTDGRYIVYDSIGALGKSTVSDHGSLVEALLEAQRLAAEDPRRAAWGEDLTPPEYAALALEHREAKNEPDR